MEISRSIDIGGRALSFELGKVARQANRHKRDNLVDIAGYARTAAMLSGDE